MKAPYVGPSGKRKSWNQAALTGAAAVSEKKHATEVSPPILLIDNPPLSLPSVSVHTLTCPFLCLRLCTYRPSPHNVEPPKQCGILIVCPGGQQQVPGRKPSRTRSKRKLTRALNHGDETIRVSTGETFLMFIFLQVKTTSAHQYPGLCRPVLFASHLSEGCLLGYRSAACILGVSTLIWIQ
jgi:hypothetical protein